MLLLIQTDNKDVEVMFQTLFLKESKQIVRSIVYYIYVVVFVMFLSSQLGSELTERMEKPEEFWNGA